MYHFFYWKVFCCNSHVIFVVHLFSKGAGHISILHTHCFILLLKFWETQKQELTWSKSIRCKVNDLTNLDRSTTQLIVVYVCPCLSRKQNLRLSALDTLERTRSSSSRVERLWSKGLLGPINLSRVMTRYWLYILQRLNQILQTFTGDKASPNLSPEANLLNHVTQLLRDGAF